MLSVGCVCGSVVVLKDFRPHLSPSICLWYGYHTQRPKVSDSKTGVRVRVDGIYVQVYMTSCPFYVVRCWKPSAPRLCAWLGLLTFTLPLSQAPLFLLHRRIGAKEHVARSTKVSDSQHGTTQHDLTQGFGWFWIFFLEGGGLLVCGSIDQLEGVWVVVARGKKTP